MVNKKVKKVYKNDYKNILGTWFDLVRFGIEGQNLGTFLENKVHSKSKSSKYVNTKSCCPIFIILNERKAERLC